MDRLTALSSFVRVCETGTFSSAARELGLTQPAISQQIRSIETRLGVRLFDRTTRRVSLTEAGARYLEHTRAALEQLDEADRAVGSFEAAMCGRLTVGAPVGFGTSILASYLIEFKRTYPDLFLDVALTDKFVDVIGERLDVSIRMGTITDERLVVRKLGLIERCLAATPGYLDRKGRPKHPRDLADHDYLLHAQIIGGDTIRLTDMSGQLIETQVQPIFRSDNSTLISEAVLSGLGFGLIHKLLLDPLIEEGKLEYVLPHWRYEPQYVYAVYPSNRYVPSKVRTFVDGLAHYMRVQGALVDVDAPVMRLQMA